MRLHSFSSSVRGDASRPSARRSTLAFLPVGGYAPIRSPPELEGKQDPSVSVRESDSTLNTQPTRPRLVRRPTPAIEPESLSHDSRSEVFYNVYDIFLCVLAVALLVKTTLVIFAWEKDRIWRGAELDRVSHMTKSLIELNDEVRPNRILWHFVTQ